MRGHQLENELISLSPAHYEAIEDLFTKFKALVLQLRQCGIENKYDHLILSILSKLGPKYYVYVSTFHSKKLTTRNWKIPALVDFISTSHQFRCEKSSTAVSLQNCWWGFGVSFLIWGCWNFIMWFIRYFRRYIRVWSSSFLSPQYHGFSTLGHMLISSQN